MAFHGAVLAGSRHVKTRHLCLHRFYCPLAALAVLFSAMEGQELSILDELEQRFQRLEKCMKWFLDLKVNERLYALECKGKESDALATLLHEDAGLEFHDADVFSEITTARTCITLGTKSVGVDMPKLPDSDESERMRFSFQKQTTSSLGMRFQEPEDLTPQEYYKFAASTWDLVLFAGHERVGRVGSIQSIVLVCATILMQGVFAGIAWFNFLISEIDESTVADALQWRLSAAHSSTQYDAVVGKSLVERVCAEDKSLHVSGIQMTLYDDIQKYLQLDQVGVASFFNGQTLCIVALLCWYMMVAKEVSQALALHRAILALPTSPGEPTKIQARENPFTQMIVYRLKSTTWKRKVVSYMLLVYRLLAAGFLIYVGSFFLAYTVNVTELLLNAVSLDIILDIDNYIFMACASTAGKDLLDRLEPLQVPSYPRFKGTDVKSVLLTLLVPCLTIAVYIGILQPMTDTLTQVSHLLCGGEHNFIWAVDHRHFTLLSRTNSSQNMNFAQLDAVKEAGAFLSEQYGGFGLWVDQPSHLTNLLSRSIEDQIAELNPDCGDVADRDEIMLNYLRDSLDDWSVQSCADVVGYCTSLTGLPDWTIDGGRGFVTRMLCSETCGCSDPGGEFIFVQGCPYSSKKCVMSDRYLTKLHDPQQSDCTHQRSAAELRNFTPWRSWTQQLRAYANHPSNDLPGRKEVGFLAEAMWEVGCEFEHTLRLKNVTFGTHYVYNPPFHWGFKTLAYFCPQSAGCTSLPLVIQDNRCPMPFGCLCNGMCTASDGGRVQFFLFDRIFGSVTACYAELW